MIAVDSALLLFYCTPALCSIDLVLRNVYEITMGLEPYLGLRGNALLRAAVMLVVCPTFTCYGYNMSVAGGLLTLDAFNVQFPRMDTIHTNGALQHENSQIQGWCISSE